MGPQEAAAWGGSVPVCALGLRLPITGQGPRQQEAEAGSLAPTLLRGDGRRSEGPAGRPGSGASEGLVGPGHSQDARAVEARTPGARTVRLGRDNPGWPWAAVVRHHLPVGAGGAGARQSRGRRGTRQESGEASAGRRGPRCGVRQGPWPRLSVLTAVGGLPSGAPEPWDTRAAFRFPSARARPPPHRCGGPGGLAEIGEVILGRAETSVRWATPPSRPRAPSERHGTPPTIDRNKNLQKQVTEAPTGLNLQGAAFWVTAEAGQARAADHRAPPDQPCVWPRLPQGVAVVPGKWARAPAASRWDAQDRARGGQGSTELRARQCPSWGN